MKNIFFSILLVLLFSCSSNTQLNNCFQGTIAPISLDLNSPQLNNLLVPGGHVIIPDGTINGIVLYNKGNNSSTFSSITAVDLTCPNNDCNSPMSVSIPILECTCDQSKYSILDGAIQAGDGSCNARIFNVIESGSSLQITN